MTQNNIKIAITGGIGSGKSEVLKIIGESYPVFSCDKIYAELFFSGAFAKPMYAEFGNEVFTDGKLDKAKISTLVFSDGEALNKLNLITHPLIMQTAFDKLSGQKIGFLEVPLLFENGLEKYFDGVIVVLRDKNKRIAAAAKRDNITPEEVQKRIKSQHNYEISDFAEYYVIHNNANLPELTAKTRELLKNIEQKYF